MNQPIVLIKHASRALRLAVALPCLVTFVVAEGVPTGTTALVPASSSERVMSLDECLTTAMENNRRRPASRFAIAAAEAQHRQALSGYWPQVRLQAAYMRLDEPPEFLFPPSVTSVPAQNLTTPPTTALITVPAGVLGPTAVQLPVSVPSQTISTPAQDVSVSSYRVKLMDPESVTAAVDVTWLLYDGGMRSGLNQQAKGYVDAMKQAARRTDLEVADTVRRMYYGAVLAAQLHTLGSDTLARMNSTLGFTETFYKEGGGRVSKADYLDNKIMVESIRAMVAQLEKNMLIARAALANSAGLPWQASIIPADQALPYEPLGSDLSDLVSDAYEFSPDWQSLEAGLRASEGAVQTARSGHSPKVALTGKLHRWWNDYDAGMATKPNRQGWAAGIGIELPIFDGLLTRNKISMARARLGELREQKILLREGLGLQIKDLFLSLDALRKASDATRAAMDAAAENRDLNTRAYHNELVETDKVIRSQLMEAMMTAQHYKNLYDHAAARSRLTLVVGTEITRRLDPATTGDRR